MNDGKELKAARRSKIEASALELLRQQHERLQLLEAEIAALRSSFEYSVTKEMISRHLNAKAHAFCVVCGCIHHINSPSCEC